MDHETLQKISDDTYNLNMFEIGNQFIKQEVEEKLTRNSFEVGVGANKLKRPTSAKPISAQEFRILGSKLEKQQVWLHNNHRKIKNQTASYSIEVGV